MLVGRRRQSPTEHMRQIFERIDVDILGAAGQEGAERCPIVFVDNGACVRRRQAVLPQDRYDGGSGEGARNGSVRPRIGTSLTASHASPAMKATRSAQASSALRF